MDALSRHRRIAACAAPALACALALALGGQAALAAMGGQAALAAMALPRGAPEESAVERQPASASLERCITASGQIERYASFAGRMTALPGTAEMAMKIDIEVRTRGQASFHRVEGAGDAALAAWRTSEPGVKIFKDVKQVTNLEAPAAYRAVISFRWLGARTASGGRSVIKHEVLRSPACRQPDPEGQVGGETPAARMP